MRIVVWNSAT